MKTSTQKIRLSADGIRGIALQWPLNYEGVFRIGYALGLYLKEHYQTPTVVMGRDTRPSGRALSEQLQLGLAVHGVQIHDMGIMTTPGVSCLTRDKKKHLGIVVSASHSVAKYNGIKWVGPDGWRLTADTEKEIIRLLDSCDYDYEKLLKTTIRTQIDASSFAEEYISAQVQLCGLSSLKGLRIVLDCANGAASRVAPAIFKRFNADVIALNASLVDGERINEQSGSELARISPQDLTAIVRRYDADYGFAFDGDGDRLVAVDNDNNVFNGDDFLFVLASYYKSQGVLRGNTIVTTSMANTGLGSALKGEVAVVLTLNGDKHLEQKMKEDNYYLGAEQIGNVIFNDGYHAAADSLYAALALIRATYEEGRTLFQAVSGFDKHPQVLATIFFADEEPLWETTTMPIKLQAELQRQIQVSMQSLGEGARIITWRSTTEPEKFNVMIEGRKFSSLASVRQQANAICRTIQQNTRSATQEPLILNLSARHCM
jgi:phosphoglucosamine mutase